MNEKSVDAHLVFRTHSRGRVIDLLAVIGENLTRTKPGLLGNQATYLGLAALYAILVAALLRAVGRMRT